MQNQTAHPSGDKGSDGLSALQQRQVEALENIRRLKSKASRGLFSLALFITLSIGAVRDFDFLPSFSPQFRALLGRPPSSNMISAALMLYSFSAIILILSRMASGSASSSGIAHVGYLAGFFFFYHFAGAMEANFWAVFAAGLTILSLESYHSWTRCTEDIKKEQEALQELHRTLKKKHEAEE
ncbi:menaquinol oxidoreductase [Geobacter sp. DSM 9736]|uniref:menaquinol oxidoreductase n=1 Tax=Geobacter sp. DSM 9736 TaxID=1277350 RepID=UPI000B5009CF|nr:menaquinol oxidoreductase [Geobacter sp. DSM 9736]SNB48073.1 hypothetical protein SAMN06269301_3569 [Geobacter sp. DSM 9736]